MLLSPLRMCEKLNCAGEKYPMSTGIRAMARLLVPQQMRGGGLRLLFGINRADVRLNGPGTSPTGACLDERLIAGQPLAPWVRALPREPIRIHNRRTGIYLFHAPSNRLNNTISPRW
jgi:hypothetical protein